MRSQLFFALALVTGGAVYGTACDRETLIGIDVPPLGSGGRYGSGGTFGPGSGGTFGPGSGGTIGGGSGGEVGPGSGGTSGPGSGGSAGVACSVVSLQPGVLNGCGDLTSAAFSPDGTLLATAGQDSDRSNLRVWRVCDGQLAYEVSPVSNVIFNVSFSPDGKLLAAAGRPPIYGAGNFGAAVFDAATGALIAKLPTQSGPYVSALAFSHDGTRLVTGGQESLMDVWKVADWTELLAIPTFESIYQVDFAPDDSRFITSGSSGIDQILETSNGSEVAEIGSIYPEMHRATYSPNGQLILTAGDIGKLQVLDATAMVLQVLTFDPLAPGVNPIASAAWIDDSHFVAGDWNGKVEEWSKDSAQPRGSFSLTKTWNMPSQVWGFAVAPDRQSFVVTGNFGFEVLTP